MIPKSTKNRPAEIQSGLNTQTHGHAIKSSSFNTKKIKVRVLTNPIPPDFAIEEFITIAPSG